MLVKDREKYVAEKNAERQAKGLDPLPKVSCSFSGGRTSAVMTKRLWDELRETHDIRVMFSNTSCEDDRTLDFIHEFETRFDCPVIWLEAVVGERGVGIRHRVVDYATAKRDGSVFEEVTKKYGIFNQTKPSCTARLKVDVMQSYFKDIGWATGAKREHTTAVGIRADEIDRRSKASMKKYGVFYPMIEWGMTKRDVAIEIKKWGFDLTLPGDHWGNCKWCWKKTDRKLYTLAKEDPSVFEVPLRLEREYGHLDAEADRKNVSPDGRAYFFRKHRSAADIIKEAWEKDFEPYSDDPYDHAYDFDEELDVGGSCGESCEPWADEEE